MSNLKEQKYWIEKLTEAAMKDFPDNIGEDHSNVLAEIEDRINTIQEKVYGRVEPTVKSVLVEINELTQYIPGNTEDEFTLETIVALIAMQVDLLAAMLGIELEE